MQVWLTVHVKCPFMFVLRNTNEFKWTRQAEFSKAQFLAIVFFPNNRPITVNQLDWHHAPPFEQLYLLLCSQVIVLIILPMGVPLPTFWCQVRFFLTTWPCHLHQQELASYENNQNQALCIHHLHDIPKQKQNLGYNLSSWLSALETFVFNLHSPFRSKETLCKSQRFFCPLKKCVMREERLNWPCSKALPCLCSGRRAGPKGWIDHVHRLFHVYVMREGRTKRLNWPCPQMSIMFI